MADLQQPKSKEEEDVDTIRYLYEKETSDHAKRMLALSRVAASQGVNYDAVKRSFSETSKQSQGPDQTVRHAFAKFLNELAQKRKDISADVAMLGEESDPLIIKTLKGMERHAGELKELDFLAKIIKTDVDNACNVARRVARLQTAEVSVKANILVYDSAKIRRKTILDMLTFLNGTYRKDVSPSREARLNNFQHQLEQTQRSSQGQIMIVAGIVSREIKRFRDLGGDMAPYHAINHTMK